MMKKGAIRIITSEINIIDGKSISEKESGRNLIFQMPMYNPSVKKKKNIKLFYINY